LRDYGEEGQIGLEDTPEQFIQKLVDVFREVRRVLKDDGTLWVNIGDSYCGTGDKGNYKDPKYANGRNAQSVSKTKNIDGIKHKDLIGIPWMLAFALRADGWYLRQDIIWHKPNPMPESVTDRCTKSHEYIFLMSKSQRYYFDHEAIQEEATGYDGRKDTMMHGGKKYDTDDYLAGGKRNSMASRGHERWRFKNLQEDGQRPNTMHERRAEGLPDIVYPVRNKRDVWSVNVKPDTVAHFATYPEELIRPCILAGCPKDGIVLDPFMGSGTTARVAMKLDRNYIGFELNPEYCKIINTKTREIQKELFT
jgi:DNA modification methylase